MSFLNYQKKLFEHFQSNEESSLEESGQACSPGRSQFNDIMLILAYVCLQEQMSAFVLLYHFLENLFFRSTFQSEW